MGEGQPEHEKLAKLFSNGFPVLLPMIDILNYKPGAKVEWQARYNFVGLQVLDQFQQGQEICNNYGPRDNETCKLISHWEGKPRPRQQAKTTFMNA